MDSLRCDAIPSAVEIFPSIPASPLLAKVSIPERGAAKPSISLIGREEAIYSVVPLRTCAAISRAMSGSDHCENCVMTSEALFAYFSHRAL